MAKRILLVRTHKNLNAGGTVPPLGLLYLSSSILEKFPGRYEIKILDTGLTGIALEFWQKELNVFAPDILGLSALSCEADLVRELAGAAKSFNQETLVIAGGPYATLARESVLADPNIDIAVIGEGEETIAELLAGLENRADLAKIQGIAYRNAGSPLATPARRLIPGLDRVKILPEAWELIDPEEYSGFANWNGARKNKKYVPLLTSRGCPFNCFFCRSRDTFGQTFRPRSPENVIEEIIFLKKKFGVREIHIFDDVFNYDPERARRICEMLIAREIKVDIAFPNGLRADLMSDELISLFKRAGVYKINYGIESASARVQKTLGKDLDLERVKEVIAKTVKAGIITAGYFIFGFPGETRSEILETAEFAGASRLDNAYFFKFTDFGSQAAGPDGDLSRLHFHDPGSTGSEIPAGELNELILSAQQRFYARPARLLRGMVRSPRKTEFFKNIFSLFSLMIVSYLMLSLSKTKRSRLKDEAAA